MFIWGKPRGENTLDSGAHFYENYETKDGKFMAVGAIEPQFYDDLLKGLGLTDEDLPQYGDPEESKAKMRGIFATKTREEWTEIFDQLDACVTPVMELEEANSHPHNLARGALMPSPKGRFEPVSILTRSLKCVS